MPSSPQKLSSYILLTTIMLLFLGGQILQLNIGWADNHDFRRVNQLFTDGPAGFSESNLTQDSPEYNLRYNNYWLPEWNLKWRIPSLYSAFSSTILLWLPGVFLNIFFVDQTTLSMTVLSIFSRLLVGASILLLAGSLPKKNKYILIWALFFILPLIILFSDSYYAAYFNAFYQDVGTLVYLTLLVSLLIIRAYRSNLGYKFVDLILVILLSTTKSSNFYFFILFAPLLFDIKQIFKNPARTLPVIALGFMIMAFSLQFVGDRSLANRYHSLFLGTLTGSENPTAQLQKMGIEDPNAYQECKHSFYSAKGQACAEKYADYLSYPNIVKTILREPKILSTQVEKVASQMNKLDIGFGMQSLDTGNQKELVSIWSDLKKDFFPTSWALYAFAGLQFGALSFYRQRFSSPHLIDLALTLITGYLLSMFVAIFGDGVADLVKHLLTANFFFDIALLLTLTITAFFFVEKVEKRM